MQKPNQHIVYNATRLWFEDKLHKSLQQPKNFHENFAQSKIRDSILDSIAQDGLRLANVANGVLSNSGHRLTWPSFVA